MATVLRVWMLHLLSGLVAGENATTVAPCPFCATCPLCFQQLCAACAQSSTSPRPADSTSGIEPAKTTEASETTSSAEPGSLLKCELNCYGDSSTPVAFNDEDPKAGVPADSPEACRQLCFGTKECEAVTYGQGRCYGKASVMVPKCQMGEGYTTEFVKALPSSSCTLLGDPHILSFDNPHGKVQDVTELRNGYFTLVDSKELKIDGRFGYTKRFPAGSSLTGIAVSGSLVRNQRLVVMYSGTPNVFDVTLDNQTILNKGGAEEKFNSDNIDATFGKMDPERFQKDARHTIGGTSGSLPSYLFEINPDIRIYLLLGEDTMNMVITMRRIVSGQDGLCGNFNCDADDDMLDALKERGWAGKMHRNESLFSWAKKAPVSEGAEDGKPINVQECPDATYKQAQTLCADSEEGMRAACIFDICASGDPTAGKSDMLAESLAEQVQEKFGWVNKLHFGSIPIPASVTLVFAGLVALASVWLVSTVGRARRMGREYRYQKVVRGSDDAEMGEGIFVDADGRGDCKDERATKSEAKALLSGALE